MEFIKRPYLPLNRVNKFLCDENLTINDSYLKSYKHNNILSGINTHPDMTICPLYDGDFLVCREGYEYYKKLLDFGINIIKGENEIKKEYPYDIAFNVVIIDDKLFHNLEYTDRKILSYCEEKNITPVNVKQGYTKCSTLIVDEKSVITSDKKLNDIYIKNDIASIYVSPKDIRINGFDHGFIGGCGGKISKDTMGFFGDIRKYRDFNKINDFLNKRGIGYEILIDGPLFDYGSLIPLCTY